MAVDSSNNVIVTGHSYSGSTPGYLTIQYSSAGVPLWTNRYNAPNHYEDIARAVAVDGSNNVIVTGDSIGNSSDADFATVKYGPPTPPAIITQPASRTNDAGTDATFTVLAIGTPPLSYQWIKNGTNYLTDGVHISGSTSNVLTLSTTTTGDAGSYTVIITNAYGSVTSTVATLRVDATCVMPPAGLIALWRAESNALDSVWTNHGTLLNGAGFTNGMVGQAFSFDGVDDEIVVPHNANFNASNQITIEAWVNLSSPGHGRTIAQKRSSSNVGGYTFEIAHSPFGPDNALQWAIWIGGTPITLQSPANVMVIGTWQHVAATFDGTKMKIYVNGALATNMSVSGVADAVTDPFVIGRNVSDPSFAWDGLIDELSIYNRALASNEVAAIYAAGIAGKCVGQVAPVIITAPQSQRVVGGTAPLFAVGAVGTTPLAYQWQKNGTNLTNDVHISGSTSNVLTLSTTTTNDTGSYTVIITNAYGSITSAVAMLKVDTCIAIPAGLVAWWRGESNAFDSVGTNDGSWLDTASYVDGFVGKAFAVGDSIVAVPNSPVVSFAPGSEGTFECWAYRIGANLPFHIFGKRVGYSFDINYQLGIDGSSPAVPLDQWIHWAMVFSTNACTLYTNGVLYTESPGTFGAENTALFLIGGAGNFEHFYGYVDEMGIYSRALSTNEIVAIFEAGVAGKSTGALAPAIAAQPASRTDVVGTEATFRVTATGAIPLSYQWIKNATNYLTNGGKVSGVTTATLTLSYVMTNDAGSYSVVITNRAGSTNSDGATLTVIPPLTITNLVMGGSNLVFGGTWCNTGGTYYVLASTNVAARMTNWVRVATNVFGVDGAFSVTNTIDPAQRRQFFRIQVP